MSTTFRHCFLFLAACVAAGFVVAPLCAGPARAQDRAGHQVRMDVDFTVLPRVLPDGSEAPVPPAVPSGETDTAQADAAKTDGRDAAEQQPAQESPAPAEQVEQAEVPAIDSPKGTGVIRSVTLDETAQGFAIKVIADRAVGQAEVMTLDAPARLVVDIPGRWTHKGDNVIRSEGAVKHLIMGLHPDRFRMVVHFRTPPAKTLRPDVQRAGDQLRVLVALP